MFECAAVIKVRLVSSDRLAIARRLPVSARPYESIVSLESIGAIPRKRMQSFLGETIEVMQKLGRLLMFAIAYKINIFLVFRDL